MRINLSDEQLIALYWFIYYSYNKKKITKTSPSSQTMQELKDMKLMFFDLTVIEHSSGLYYKNQYIYEKIEVQLKGYWIYWLNKKRIDLLYDQILNYSK